MGSAPPRPGFLSTTQTIVAIASAVIAAWGAWITVQINQINNRLAQTNAEREWTAKIFDKYADAITREKLGIEQRMAALNGLINLTELIDRSDIRLLMNKLIRDQLDSYSQQLKLASVSQSGTEKQQTEVLAARADALASTADQNVKALVAQGANLPKSRTETPSAPPGASPVKWSNYDFDIFWCETSQGAEQIAGQIVALKGLDAGATGRWRVRKMTAEVNARQGFRLKGFFIRTSAPDENEIATRLRTAILERKALGSQPADIRVQQVTYSTPYYISVFICPVSGA